MSGESIVYYVLVACFCICSEQLLAQNKKAIARETTVEGSLPGRGSLVRPKTAGQRVQKSQQSFKQCTAKATAAVKAGKLRLKDLPVEFGRCTDRFPAAGLFNECKKNLLKSTKGTEVRTEDVARCKAILVNASFDPATPAPIFVEDDQVVFAGVGLNRPIRVTDGAVPNYNCNQLQSVQTNIPKNGQHLLFGNHPKMFLSSEQYPKLLQRFQPNTSKKQKGTGFSDILGFGRLFGDLRSNQAVVYFPAGSCEYEASSGSLFAGLNLFYLVEEKSRFATPYFGIAYYRPGQKTVNTPELVADVIRKLGPNYKPYSKNAHTVFVASTPFKEVDKERDPRNICELPRSHRLVAVVHTLKDAPNTPEYLLLANIRNLCDYGDRRASSLLQ